MTKRVLINQIDFTNRVEIDLSFVEKLDRELDEGYISIPHTRLRNPFNLLDVVDIYEDETLIFSGRISRDFVTVSSFSEELYNHEIQLIEHTKMLERFMVKGKTHTQSLNPNVPQEDLLEVLNKLRETTPLELNDRIDRFRPFYIPQETEELLSGIIAPEFNFKDLTLRQALDQIGSVIDSIARVDSRGNLTFTRFDELKEKITIAEQQFNAEININDYALVLESEMLNAVEGELDNKELQEVYPGESGWTSVRSNDYLFGFTDNAHIPTPRPIYKVNGLKYLIFATFSSLVGGVTTEYHIGWIEIDLANRIVEKETWDTLEPLRSQNDPTLRNRKNFFQNNTLYYEYGRKNIYIGELYGLFGVDTVLQDVITVAALDEGVRRGWFPEELEENFGFVEGVQYSITPSTAFEISNNKVENGQTNFRVYYTPLIGGLRWQTHRDDVGEINLFSEQTANQQTRIIDVSRFANNLKGRVNRMGGSIHDVSHRVGKWEETYDIGDFVKEGGAVYVITKKEVIVHRNFYTVNYNLTRNFNKFSQFMGVDQEIRQAEVGSSNRTVERDLVYSEYIEVEASDSGEGEVSIETLLTISPVLQTFNPTVEHTPIQLARVKTDVQSESFLIGLNKNIGGNAISLNFEFPDNIRAGTQNLLAEEWWGNSNFWNFLSLLDRRFNEPSTYADERGRLQTLRFQAYRDLPPLLELPEGSGNLEFGDFLLEIGNLTPSVSDEIFDNIFPSIDGEWYVAKDNREVLKFNLMYHFLPRDVQNIVIGQKFVEQSGLVKRGFNTVQLYIYNNRRFDVSDKNKSLEAPDVFIEEPNLTFDTANNKIIVNENISEGQSYALVDDNGFPYVMVNNNKKHILFHFRNKRSGVRYNVFFIFLEREVSGLVSAKGFADGEFVLIPTRLALGIVDTLGKVDGLFSGDKVFSKFSFANAIGEADGLFELLPIKTLFNDVLTVGEAQGVMSVVQEIAKVAFIETVGQAFGGFGVGNFVFIDSLVGESVGSAELSFTPFIEDELIFVNYTLTASENGNGELLFTAVETPIDPPLEVNVTLKSSGNGEADVVATTAVIDPPLEVNVTLKSSGDGAADVVTTTVVIDPPLDVNYNLGAEGESNAQLTFTPTITSAPIHVNFDLTANGDSNASLNLKKRWSRDDSPSAQWAVALDLGVVSSCPSVATARNILENESSATNQPLGARGKITARTQAEIGGETFTFECFDPEFDNELRFRVEVDKGL